LEIPIGLDCLQVAVVLGGVFASNDAAFFRRPLFDSDIVPVCQILAVEDLDPVFARRFCARGLLGEYWRGHQAGE
jgi:hypothetical protein